MYTFMHFLIFFFLIKSPSLSLICVCVSLILMTVTTALFTCELLPRWVCFPYPRRLTSALRIALPPEGRPREGERWEVKVIKKNTVRCVFLFTFSHRLHNQWSWDDNKVKLTIHWALRNARRTTGQNILLGNLRIRHLFKIHYDHFIGGGTKLETYPLHSNLLLVF